MGVALWKVLILVKRVQNTVGVIGPFMVSIMNAYRLKRKERKGSLVVCEPRPRAVVGG